MAATLETSHHLLVVHCVGYASPLITSWSGSGSITSPSVLAYPNFDRWFVLHTDASRHGLGAVLEQEHDDGLFHPIAYASRTLSKHKKWYGVTDMEALGVVWAAKHFRAYLLGRDCTVFTDHAPLKAMLKAKHQTGKLARWGSRDF